MMSLVLRWAGCLDEGFRACHTRGTSPGGQLPRAAFYAKSDYFDEPLPARGRQTMIDWIERRQRTPSLGSGALHPRRLRRRLQPARRRRHGVRAPRHAVLAPVRRLLQRQRRARAARWINGVWRALRPFASGQAYQNYIDPQLTTLAAGLLRLATCRGCARSRSRSTPTSCSASARRSRRPARAACHIGGGPRLAPPPARPARLPAVRQRRDARARLGRDVLGRRRAARARPHRQRRPGRADGGRDHAAEPDLRPAARAPGST